MMFTVPFSKLAKLKVSHPYSKQQAKVYYQIFVNDSKWAVEKTLKNEN